MRVKYYRYLFHKVTDGLCYSGSISSQMEREKESFVFFYAAGGETCREDDTSYSAENAYDCVILGDISPAAIERACVSIRAGKPAEVYVPMGTEEKDPYILTRLREAGAGCILTVDQEYTMTRCRETFHLIPAEWEGHTEVMLLHADETGIPENEECILSVKPSIEGMRCTAKTDHEKMTCEMRCMLYNDFTLCKRHNQRGQKQFLNGHFLCPSIKANTFGMKNESAAGEVMRQCRDRIRFLGIGDKDLTCSDLQKIESFGEKGYARYVIGMAGCSPEVIKKLVTEDPYQQFFAVGEQAGLCISGYYAERLT